MLKIVLIWISIGKLRVDIGKQQQTADSYLIIH
nr:MAG TPA: hypothetical protein [Caudoviricetes sp.]